MSETVSGEQSQAREFESLHVHPKNDYETYAQKMLEQWKVDAEAAIESGSQIKPMWLRRNGDSYTHFAAHVDYIMPIGDEFRYMAAVDISSDGNDPQIQVWLPKEDGSGEPVFAVEEPYSLDSLQRALIYVEEQFDSNPS